MQKILITTTLLMLSLGVAAQPVSMLVYQVWEKGVEPYVSRVMVSPDYVRLDEGAESEGYTLFDRRQEIIYNVLIEDQSILVMNSSESLPEASAGLILEEEVKVDPEAPTIAGLQPKNVRLLANGELCSEMVVIDGVMGDALEGLRELKLTLARIQAVTQAAMPLGTDSPCDLASGLYAADRSLKFGLPVQERSAARSQSLVDFAPDYEADDTLFSLPQGFSRRSMFSSDPI